MHLWILNSVDNNGKDQSRSSSSTEIYNYGNMTDTEKNYKYESEDFLDIHSTNSSDNLTDDTDTQYSFGGRFESGKSRKRKIYDEKRSPFGIVSDESPHDCDMATEINEDETYYSEENTKSSSAWFDTNNNTFMQSTAGTKNVYSHTSTRDASQKRNTTKSDSRNANTDPSYKKKFKARIKKNEHRTMVHCPVCNMQLMAKSLKRHLTERHKQDQQKYSITRVDAINAIFMVSKTTDGIQFPIHVKNKNWGNDKDIRCQLELCMSAKTIARDAGNVSWVCEHIQATQHYDMNHTECSIILQELSLDDLVQHKIFSATKKDACIELNDMSKISGVPVLSEHLLKPGSSDKK